MEQRTTFQSMKKLIFRFTLLLIFSIAAITANAQITLKGIVQDEDTREELIGASILIRGTSTGTATEADGTFELNVNALPVTLVISYAGYSELERTIEDASESIVVRLSSEAIVTEVVEIRGQRIDEKKKAQL